MKERQKTMSNFAAAIAWVLALTSCANTSVPTSSPADIAATSVEASVIEVMKPEYDSEDYYTEWTFDNSIVFDGDSITASGSSVVVNAGSITITTAGTYVVSGTLNDGQIIIDADKEDIVRIVLNGVNITSKKSSPVYVKQAEKVIITLADGSENIVTDSAEYVFESAEETEPDSAIFSKDDLIFNGTGTLTVNANYNDAIKAKDDLVIMSGTFNVTSADDGIVGKDSITIKDALFNITTAGDGIKTTNTDVDKGYLTIENGTFNITSQKDGIQSENTLYLLDGKYNITTGEGGEKIVQASRGMPDGRGPGGNMMNGRMDRNENAVNMMPDNENSESRPIPGNGSGSGASRRNRGERPENPPNDKINNAGMTPPERPAGENMAPPEMPENAAPQGMPPGPLPGSESTTRQTASESETDSLKALKAGNNITVEGGTFNISSEDDAVHSNLAAYIIGGVFEIKTSDDALHAETLMDISGGDINITNSFEGIEAAKINISGGNINIVSSDDGLNSSDGSGDIMYASESCLITISGGYTNITSTVDGVDSNGNVIMNGGTLIVSGASNGGEDAIDCNGSYTVNSGTLFAVGSSNMLNHISGDSEQAAMSITLPSTQSAGTILQIADKRGNEVVAFAPSKQYQTVLVSTADIKKGESYTINYGGSHSGNVTDGLYSGGSYSGGTILTTFEMTDNAMTVNPTGATVKRDGGIGGGMPPRNNNRPTNRNASQQ